MTATIADPIVTPSLSERIKTRIEAHEDGLNTVAALGAGTVAAAISGGTQYVGYIIAVHFLKTIAVPAWLLTMTHWSMYGAVGLAAITAFFTAYGWVRNR